MIQVLERFHKLLAYVAEHPERPCRVRELMEVIGTSQPTCSNIIASMVKTGYLEAVPETHGYRLGPMPSLLVRSGTYRQYLTRIARPHMDRLTEEINENCLLAVNSDFKRVVLLTREAGHALQFKEAFFTENLMHTSTGILMLAHLPPKELDYYESVHPFQGSIYPEIKDWKAFRAKLKEARANGYAEDCSHTSPDARNACAAAVFGRNGFECALGCWYPRARVSTAKQRTAILSGVRASAQRISQALKEYAL